MKCFKGQIDASLLDRKPFQFNHNLLNHPALSIESLSKTIPQIPRQQVMYSKGLTDLGINFDRAHIDHKNGLTLEETIENIRHSSSYIAIRSPEVHPAFHELFADMKEDVGQLIQANRKGYEPIEPACWLFIASPKLLCFLPIYFRKSPQLKVF